MSSEPIRILHVIGSMNRGGAEAMIMNLYRQIDRTRVQFDFVENTLQPAAFDDEIRELGGRIFNCPHYNGKNHLIYKRWWKHFFSEHRGEFSAVHGHLGSTAAIYLPIAKSHGVYTIAHSHNTRGQGFGDWLYHMYALPTRHIADYFFACSKDAGSDRYGEKVASDSTHFRVLNNAIDVRRFAFDPKVRSETRSALGVSETDVLIGHVGRFVEQKNHVFLTDIFAAICRKNPNAKLLLIGKEDPEKKIRAKVKASGLSDRVIIAGVQENVSPYYQAMDLFLMPSLYEGLGVVLVEAQCSGLPCLISDKIPLECSLTDDLIAVCYLSDGAEVWAERSLSHMNRDRRDRSDEIAANGYDVRQTAEWLADFYCEKAKQA